MCLDLPDSDSVCNHARLHNVVNEVRCTAEYTRTFMNNDQDE